MYTDPVSAAPAIAQMCANADHILLLSHVNPDGDAISSMLGMWHMLQYEGKHTNLLASSALPNYVRVLPGVEHIRVYERGMTLPETDLVCVVDTSRLDRLGPVYEDHGVELATRATIVIDHHVTNTGAGKINLVVPESASCAELVYHLLRALGTPITPDMATCLLLGIYTDTMSYQTSSTNPATMRTAADLIEAGANQWAIVEALYRSLPFATVCLLGLAFHQVRRAGDVVWVHITQEMLHVSGAPDEAIDEMIITMQRIAEARVCVLFKERPNGETKIGLRSKPGIDVAAIAATWGGGGHTQAAGATLAMTPAAAESVVLARIQEQLATRV
jgi:phosphoesterase RecJ-like protein